MTADDWSAIRITLSLAGLTTLLLLLLATPLAWWLAHRRGRLRAALAALVSLPLVLPPTVLGFYLLIATGPQGPIGALTTWLGIGGLPFTFTGLVVASLVYSLPFFVQPVQAAFEAIGRAPLEAAATLRAGPREQFLEVILPLARPGLLAGSVLAFTHTIGEFGIVLMMGGNIPGRTQVLSMQIYNHVEALEYAAAHRLAGGLLAFSFLVLLALYSVQRRAGRG